VPKLEVIAIDESISSVGSGTGSKIKCIKFVNRKSFTDYRVLIGRSDGSLVFAVIVDTPNETNGNAPVTKKIIKTDQISIGNSSVSINCLITDERFILLGCRDGFCRVLKIDVDSADTDFNKYERFSNQSEIRKVLIFDNGRGITNLEFVTTAEGSGRIAFGSDDGEITFFGITDL